MLDGRHTGTGGGNHIVLGGPTPADSPLLRRPDLLRSLIGLLEQPPRCRTCFPDCSSARPARPARRRGPKRKHLRVGDGLRANSRPRRRCPPWLVDRVFRHLLVDVTGNTHRAEFCIDKLYSPDTSSGRLGLLEFRAFEMPPHAAHEPDAAIADAGAGRAVLEDSLSTSRWCAGAPSCTTGSCCRTSWPRTSAK